MGNLKVKKREILENLGEYMVKRGGPEEGKNMSFVKITNANLLSLTFKQIAQEYTRYADKVLEINEIREEKAARVHELKRKISEFDTRFERLMLALPKRYEEKVHVVQEIKPKPEPVRDVESFDVTESFQGLRDEFERIKQELESIR